MREQLKNIHQAIENKSRCGFIFTKGKFVDQIEGSLNEVENSISNLETEYDNLTSRHHHLEDEHNQLTSNFEDLTVKHHNLESEHNTLNSDFKDLTDKHHKLESEHSTLTSNFKDLTSNHQNLESEHNALTSNFKDLTSKHHNLESEHNTLTSNFKDLTSKHHNLESEHNALTSNFKDLTSKHHNLESEHNTLTLNFKDLTDKHNELELEHNTLTSDFKSISNKNKDLELKEQLVSSLLSAEFKHKGIEKFNYVLDHDFMEFANSESSLEQEAKAILKLKEISYLLEDIAIYPEFFNKRKIAVGGGFSSGKSQFINSLLMGEMKLPIDIKPTTAIPTYVMNGKENGLFGYNYDAMVNLTKIDPDISRKLSHEFISSFGFNLKDIMPYMVMNTKLLYQHLCFVDTPGYNPSGSQSTYTDEDKTTANDFIKKSDAILWLIPVTAGTLPQSDIEFLSDVRNENKPLYIVINKCDLRPQSVIKEVMEEIKDKLDDEEIEYAGISAYSSSQKKFFLSEKESLLHFLNKQNKPIDSTNMIMYPLKEVEKMYHDAITRDITQKSKIKAQLDEIRHKLTTNRDWRNWSSDEDSVDQLYSYFDTSEEHKHLQELSNVMKKFTEAVEMVFPKLPKNNSKKWMEQYRVVEDEKGDMKMVKEIVPTSHSFSRGFGFIESSDRD